MSLRRTSPSAKTRAPSSVPKRIPVSRAGATYDTGLIASAVSIKKYDRRHEPNEHELPPLFIPHARDIGAAAPCRGRDRDRLTADGHPVVDQRRDERDAHRGLVPKRIEGDDDAGRERVADGAAGAARAERAWIAGEDERPGDDRERADDREHRWPFADHAARADRR